MEAKALAAARHLLAEAYPKASCAIAAGSILRGQGTPSSDLDLVVVFAHLDRCWRESRLHEGLPVEVWSHDPETLAWFMDQDARTGRPIMAHMVASGRQLGPDLDLAARVVAAAEAVLAKGPPSLEGEFGRALRYQLTTLVEDIIDATGPSVRRALAAATYQPLADLMLIGRGAWSGKGKWIPRLLDALDPALAATFDAAFESAWNADAATLAELIDRELQMHGGRWFAGDKRLAPETARLRIG